MVLLLFVLHTNLEFQHLISKIRWRCRFCFSFGVMNEAPPEGFRIRTIEARDESALAGIIRATLEEFGANHPGTVYDDPSTKHLFEVFKRDRSIYFVAEQNGHIVGGAGVFPSKGLPPGTCELVKMYLLPEARGKGLGRQLIDSCFSFAKEQGFRFMYLETMPELKKAISIYEKLGFHFLQGPLGDTGHVGCGIWMLKEL